ncbi:MAG: HPr(Ser) kinase/phosphatase [Acidobacteriota bacterium]|nr:HPr(Ser) kinase/phosphatase [Acidobacteriota bacterium]
MTASGSTPKTVSDSQDHVAVDELLGDELADLKLEVLCGAAHLDNQVTNPRVQKPGLAFAGYYPYIKPGRVQIVGESELAYVKTLSTETRAERFRQIAHLPVPVFIFTKGLPALDEFLDLCRAHGRPVLRSPRLSSVVIQRIGYFLEEHLVPSTTVQGVLVEVFGLGVLLVGKSGIGKSEAGLTLITRGHSLVSDDRVRIRRYPNDELIGHGAELQQHHMELRGIGIINVKDLFGLAAIRQRKSIDLVVELEHWEPGETYDRLGLDESVYRILDSPCPYIRMPVAIGRNVAILVEIAARNHVLKLQGHFSAQEFARSLQEQLERNRDQDIEHAEDPAS